MVDRRADQAARAAKAAAVKAEQQRKERRRWIWIIAAASVVGLGLIGATTAALLSASREQAAVQEAANAPISGVEEYDDLSSRHVQDPAPSPRPTGDALPPVGGDHDPVWQNCGVYAQPVTTANAVHSLEHGAVWITYRPGITDDQLAALTDLAEGKTYMLLSPFEDLRSPVVLTAWGIQLELDDATDPRAAAFVEKYREGEQTPEPGAPCEGGVGDPA
jgi:hypothetical protein